MNDKKSLCDFCKIVSLDGYSVPPILLEEKVKEGFKSFIQNIWKSKEKEIFQPYDNLTSFTSRQIDYLVPAPDWSLKTNVLDDLVLDLDKFPVLFINKPFSGTKEIVRLWSEQTDYNILSPPSYDEILSYSTTTRKYSFDFKKDENLVILELERWFLRHHEGLDLIEALLHHLASHKGKVIVVCQSWALTFLTFLNIDFSVYTKKIFQAMDAEALQNWLLNLGPQSTKRTFLYRLANNGYLVFDLQSSLLEKTSDNDSEIHLKVDNKFSKNLAGYSLGLPMICWHIWRNSLRVKPEESFKVDQDGEETLEQKRFHPVWITPWEDIALPSVPSKLSSEEQMFLHFLLIHNSLPLDIIGKILYFDTQVIMSCVKKFKKLEIITQDEDNNHIAIAANAYPKVREHLKVIGYLIDDLEVI